MSEQQGKVIDGTARASHWRRSSPSSTPDADASPGHSEAPKNIASSLLVPAHMLLDGTAATASIGTEDGAPGEGSGEHPAGLVAGTPGTAEGLHVNLFLAAERAAALAATPGEASVLRRSIDRVVGSSRGNGESRRWQIAIRTLTTGRAITLAASTLGVLATLAVVSTVLVHSGASERQSQSVSRANSLDSLKPNILTASADPFGTKPVAHRSGVARPHHANAQLAKKHSAAAQTSTPVRTNRNQHVVMAHYTSTPATPSSAGATSDTQGSPGTGSTPTVSTSAPPTHYTSSSNSGAGSGSSSRSGNPSQATLRALVTGAGQCGCQ
jgi:hypothetical protein